MTVTGREETTTIGRRVRELRRLFESDARQQHAESSVETMALLVVTLAQQRYAVPCSHILEVLPAPPITPLPGASGDVLGLANYRGRIVVVRSLHHGLDLPLAALTSQSRMMVARCFFAAFLCDSVEGLVDVDPVSVDALPAGIDPRAAEHLTGQLTHDGRTVGLLDLTSFAEHDAPVTAAGH